MSLHFDENVYYDWCRARITQPEKLKNAKYLKQFISNAADIAPSITGNLLYYSKTSYGKYISYGEGTPVFYFFKVVPDSYYITYFEPDNLYKNHSIDKNIISVLKSHNLTKYNITANADFNYNNYILVPLQRHDEQINFIKDISTWANSNKTLVIFKIHPLSMSTTSIDSLSTEYSNKYAIFVENVDIDLLIDRCIAVWTFNSGIGFNALLAFKPVCYFLKDYDHTYGPVAKFCSSIDEAAESYTPDCEDVMRYFSWYYNTFIIDVSKYTAKDKLLKRLTNYFHYNYSIKELFDEHSAFK